MSVLFFVLTEDFYSKTSLCAVVSLYSLTIVLDLLLQSSNGVFINGKVQETKKAIMLNEGDLIGIGCAELTNLDPTMFVYKVKNRVSIQALEPF